MKRVRVSHIVLLLLCLMYGITYIDRVNVSTAAVGFAKEFDLNKAEIGLVFSAFAYPYLIFQIIGGWISDRYGARRTLIVCGIVWGSATILTGLAGGLASLLMARLLLGFGEGATFPAATTAMCRWVPTAERGRAQGLTHAAARVGNAAAPGLVVLIMAAYGWRASFFLCAGLSFMWVGLWALMFTEHPRDNPRVSAQELAALPQPRDRVVAIPWSRLFKRMFPVTMVYFCYGWTLWLFLSWIPQYFLHSHGVDLKQSALFSSCVFFAGVLGDTLGGVISDQWLRRTGSLKRARSLLVSICMLMTLVALIPLLFTQSLPISLGCLSTAFFFSEMTIGPMWAIPMDIAPNYAGVASGMMNTGSALAAIMSPVVSGYIIDVSGNWQLPFIGSMALMAAGLVLAFRMRPDSRFEDDPAGTVETAGVGSRLARR